MTVRHETIEVPATKKEMLRSVTCDICGATSIEADISGHPVDWNPSYGDQTETCVFIGEGSRYPGDYTMVYRYYHICPECFKTKLEPWLKSFGAEPTEKEY